MSCCACCARCVAGLLPLLPLLLPLLLLPTLLLLLAVLRDRYSCPSITFPCSISSMALQSLMARLQAAPQRPRSQRRLSMIGGTGDSASASGGNTPGAGLGGGAGGGGVRGGLAGGLPAEFLQDPSKYPMPLIPFLKCG